MAEVRCPMCGKPNPAELEICQFCQARLKPLVISQPESPAQEPGDEPAENTAPDWLVSLRAKDSSLGEPEEVGEEEQINLPGWLKSSTPAPAQGAANQPEGESADWLASFRGDDLEPNETVAPEGTETKAAPAEPTPKPGEEGSPDWLEAIRKDTGPFEPTEPATSGTPQATEGDPNWLERIRARRFQEDIYPPLQPDEEQEDAESLEDWLRREMGEAASGAVPTTNYEPLDYAAEAALAKNIAAPSPEIEQVPTQTGSDEPVTAELPQESIDWLSGANASPVTPEGRQPPAGEAEAEPAEHGMPSWISRKSEKPGEAAILAVGIASNVDQGIDQTGDLPDWLTGIGQGSDLPEAALGQTDELSPESQEELPAELPDASLAQEGTEEEEIPETTQPGQEKKAGWLLGAAAAAAALGAAGKKEAASTEPQVAGGEASPQAGSSLEEAEPAWIAGLAAAAPEPPTEEPAAPETKVAPFSEGAEEEIESGALEPQELPEWLIGVQVADAMNQDAKLPPLPEATQDDVGLAQADLPSWLEAMRPVETVAVAAGLAEERDQGVESAGPLAGLRGVLAAEPEISQLQRPGPYAIKLQVTDMQQARAEMMDDLVKGEGAARSVPRKLLISSQHLLQIIIALLIFLAVLSPLFIETTASVTPTFAPETGIASQIIDQLSVSQPVLVAIDYQPANSGEMDAIGSAVMDHLMLKGAYLALVSTVPSGPVQAMHLVEAVNQSADHQYSSGDQFVNLGYIPGGRNGLAALVNDPQQLLPYDLSSGRDPWTASPLQSINSLADFGLLVVMTDSAETARAWIEQVQPALEGTPLIMVNSAQIGPVVRPYYNAIPQQVQAMVTGLPGGVAYENLLGRTGMARSYWASFNMGLLAAFFAIIIGGVIMLIPVLRARMSKKKGAARAT